MAAAGLLAAVAVGAALEVVAGILLPGPRPMQAHGLAAVGAVHQAGEQVGASIFFGARRLCLRTSRASSQTSIVISGSWLFSNRSHSDSGRSIFFLFL